MRLDEEVAFGRMELDATLLNERDGEFFELAMPNTMLRTSAENQVGISIVQLVPIDVMNDFRFFDSSPDAFLNDQDVLWDVFKYPTVLWSENHTIAESLVDELTTPPRPMSWPLNSRWSKQRVSPLSAILLNRLIRHTVKATYRPQTFSTFNSFLNIRLVYHYDSIIA